MCSVAVKGLAEENEERIDKKIHTKKKNRSAYSLFSFCQSCLGLSLSVCFADKAQDYSLTLVCTINQKPGTPSLGYTVLALCMDVEILSNTLYVKYCLNFTENVC